MEEGGGKWAGKKAQERTIGEGFEETREVSTSGEEGRKEGRKEWEKRAGSGDFPFSNTSQKYHFHYIWLLEEWRLTSGVCAVLISFFAALSGVGKHLDRHERQTTSGLNNSGIGNRQPCLTGYSCMHYFHTQLNTTRTFYWAWNLNTIKTVAVYYELGAAKIWSRDYRLYWCS